MTRLATEGRLLTSLSKLKAQARRCVLLFSGGLDSTYFLLWASENGIDVVPLCVRVDGSNLSPTYKWQSVVDALNVEVREADVTDRFAAEYVANAIRANALFQGVFPVSSSLSRPLMAAVAVDVAEEVGADCVVHTADVHQNSCARFNHSIRFLAPHLMIGNPFLEEHLNRAEKLHALTERFPGLNVSRDSIYSVDQNVWARVVENGELDCIAHPVPAHVFEWTTDPERAPSDPLAIVLGFESGLPVHLAGTRLRLVDLLMTLNDVAGRYGVGRFNGVEGTRYGIKNHEVREAPAAAAVLSAHQQLEQLTLTERELRMKNAVDYEWTETVVLGGWYSNLRVALDAFEERISPPVTGDVQLLFRPGSVYVSGVSSPASLATDSHPAGEWDKKELSFEQLFAFDTAEVVARRQGSGRGLRRGQ